MFENEPYFQWREERRRLIADIQQREEAAIMKTKNCTTCGQTLPRVFPLGATVQNKFHHSLGVVLGPGVYKVPSDLLDPLTVNVILLSGANKGEQRNWFIKNTEIVHGVFNITSREAL